MVRKALCIECRERPRYKTYHRCSWCWIARQPAELQESWAAWRLSQATERPTETPAGKRWCSGCLWMVPLSYTDGSRCKACASRARHRSRIARTYEITAAEYEALLAAQGGRCYICRQVPRATRLAVDHDHVTGKVRGLLCAGQNEGCNWNFRKALGDPAMAQRLLEYATDPPMDKLRRGVSH